MRPTKTHHARRRLPLGVIFILMAAGCAGAPVATTVDIDPVPLPAYREGTTFVYANGSWEKVVAVTGETVTWENHRGHRSSGPADFTYRRSRWQTRTRQGVREFGPRSDTYLQKPTSLWPLQIGNRSGYIETGRWSTGGGEEKTYNAFWSCEVTGAGKVSVMAGEFDTVNIECKRFSRGSGRRLPRLWEVKTFAYAPAVGHFVLAGSRFTDDRAPRRKELLAVVPPQSGRFAKLHKQMERSFQLALEKRPSGESVSWSNGSAKVGGATTAVDTFRLPGGTFCRRYVQQVSFDAVSTNFYGMACRDDGGKWVVPHK